MRKYDPEREARAAQADISNPALAKQFTEGIALMEMIENTPEVTADQSMTTEEIECINRREAMRRLLASPWMMHLGLHMGF